MLKNQSSVTNSTACLWVELRTQAQLPGASGDNPTATQYCRAVFLSTFLMDASLTCGGPCQVGEGVCHPAAGIPTSAFIYFPVGLQKPPSLRPSRTPRLPHSSFRILGPFFFCSEQTHPREPWSLSFHRRRNAKLEPPPAHKSQTHPHLFAECFFSIW